MEICISCKTKTSNDRCSKKAIKGLAFCGIHARAKDKRLWYTVNNLDAKISKIQKVWRGYHIRFLLKQLGAGVLKRSLVHNTDEPVTLEETKTIYPFHYFSFEENGKLWAYHISSVSRICLQDATPLNPLTRQPFSYETRRRVRWYLRYLSRQKDHILYECTSTKEGYIYRLNQLTQILHENGFTDFRPEYLAVLTPAQAFLMRSLIAYDIQALSSPRKQRYIALLKSRTFMANYNPTFVLYAILMTILTHTWVPSEEYEICFIIMSALFRM